MQDENNLVDQTLVERATRLVPLLRKHAREAEQQRRLPDEVVTALMAAGMLSMYKPRRHGGLEARSSTAVEAWTELGRGCGSTSWVSEQAKGVFVPEARVGSTQHMLAGEPLHDEYEGPLYRAAFTPLMLLGAAVLALGMAREALDELKAQVPGRGIAFTTYAKRSEAAVTHLRFAEATAKVDTAEHRLFEHYGAQPCAVPPRPVPFVERVTTLPIQPIRARTWLPHRSRIPKGRPCPP